MKNRILTADAGVQLNIYEGGMEVRCDRQEISENLMRRLLELRAHLEKAWCRQTAPVGFWPFWKPSKPSFGQCYSTALIVQDLFGGRLRTSTILYLIPPHSASHIWNELPGGIEVDLTADQAPGGVVPFPVIHGRLLPISYAAKRSNSRYKLLKKRLETKQRFKYT